MEELKPDHIHIIASNYEVIQGEGKPSSEDNQIQSTQRNTRLEGSNDPFDRFEDGFDILISGKGDDVLIGANNSSTGGAVLDLYKFYNDSGNDLIIGYYDKTIEDTLSCCTTINNQGSGRKNDKIILPIDINDLSIDSFADINSRSSNNLDGWAKLDLGSSNYITIHGIPIESLTSDSFIFTYSETYNQIYGDGDNNIIQGTSSNDWIDGSEQFLPRFGDGNDYLFPGAGDDILVTGLLIMELVFMVKLSITQNCNDLTTKLLLDFCKGSENIIHIRNQCLTGFLLRRFIFKVFI